MEFALSWRNLWRHSRRTTLSIAAIAIVIALLVFLISLDRGIVDTMRDNSLRVYDGFVQFQAYGYFPDADMRRTISQPGALLAEVSRLSGIGGAAPRVTTFAVIANTSRSFGATVVGVDPERERSVSALASTVKHGRFLAMGDDAVAIVGDVLARNLQVGVGDRITLLGSAWDGSVAADVVEVVGIFRSGIGDLDRQIVQMPLARVQQTFAFGDRVNQIVVTTPKFADMKRLTPALHDVALRFNVNLADWADLQPSLRESIALRGVTGALFYAVLILVVVFITLNTLMMSVLERTHELGVLIAIGVRPKRVGWAVWLELAMLVFTGALLGAALGAGATLWTERQGLSYPSGGELLAQFGLPDRLYPTLDVFSVLTVPAIVLTMICVAGLAVVVRVSRLEPNSATRMLV